MTTFGHASGQYLNHLKTTLLPIGHPSSIPSPLPLSIAGIRCVSVASSLGITFSNTIQTAQAHMDWDVRLSLVRTAFSTISKLQLSTFGRASAGFGYGTSRVLYHAEHSLMPTSASAPITPPSPTLAMPPPLWPSCSPRL
jgi:hypothetical protein